MDNTTTTCPIGRGTRWGYDRYKCHCDACTKAHHDRVLSANQRRDERGRPSRADPALSRRYPIADLVNYLTCRLGPIAGMGGNEGATQHNMAIACGIEADTDYNAAQIMRKIIARGWINEPTADRWCTHLGIGICDLWPDLYWSAVA